MNNTAFATDIHICSCPNQHLLFVGAICELCMGMVSEQPAMRDFPDSVSNGSDGFRMAVADPFDELYFEELETYYEDIEYAA